MGVRHPIKGEGFLVAPKLGLGKTATDLKFFLTFIFKFSVPNRSSTFSCLCGISCLNNEPFDVPMKQASVVIIASAKGQEILEEIVYQQKVPMSISTPTAITSFTTWHISKTADTFLIKYNYWANSSPHTISGTRRKIIQASDPLNLYAKWRPGNKTE